MAELLETNASIPIKKNTNTLHIAKNKSLMSQLGQQISSFDQVDEAHKEEKFAELVENLYGFCAEKVKEYKLL